MTIKTSARTRKEEKAINAALIQELERLLAPEEEKRSKKKATPKAA